MSENPYRSPTTASKPTNGGAGLQWAVGFYLLSVASFLAALVAANGFWQQMVVGNLVLFLIVPLAFVALLALSTFPFGGTIQFRFYVCLHLICWIVGGFLLLNAIGIVTD